MHISPSGKRYIGITCLNVNRRWQNGYGYKNQTFYRAINKYGWDNFQHIIIAKGLNKETAEWLEIELIREFDTTNSNKGYNISTGGEGGSGVVLYGELNGMFGKHHTEESRKKMSETTQDMYVGKGNPRAVLYKVIDNNGNIVGIFCSNEIYIHQKNNSKGLLDINYASFKKYIKPFGNIDISRINIKRANKYTKALIEKLTPFNGWQFIEISKETEVA
jgi:group I intron endonuclease